jgi:WD40 repeat protein
MSFAEGGKSLIVACGRKQVKCFAVGDLKERSAFHLPAEKNISAGAISQDGALLAIGDDGGTVGVCRVTAMAAGFERSVSVPELKDRGVSALAFDPRGENLALGGGDCRVRIWSIQAPAVPLRSLSHCGADLFGDLQVSWVRYSSDGTRLVSTTRDFLQAIVWNVVDGTSAADTDFVCGFPRVLSAWFSHDGKTVTTNLDLRQIRLPSPEPRSVSEPPKSLLNWWCLDGEYAWGVATGALVVRKVGSSEPLLRLKMNIP